MHVCDFHPLIIGGDLGVYALARAFHEAYGCTSTVISGAELGPIKDSCILEVHSLGMGASCDDLSREALRIAPELKERYACKDLILLTNSDSQVRSVVKMKSQLEEYYLVPFVDQDLLDKLMNKDSFAELCEIYGVSTPASLTIQASDFAQLNFEDIKDKLPGGFPLIAKPANSGLYERMRFEGMKKVYKLNNKEELMQLLSRLGQAGVQSPFIIQELIPGDDLYMRSITAYVDQNAKVRMFSSAQVLLEEHTPSALGNPAAMITRPYPELYKQAQTLLEACSYKGFANFDVKLDPRTNKAYFLEINPRIGRNNYYTTAAGLNPVRYLVDDIVYHKYDKDDSSVDSSDKTVLYSVLTPHLVKRYVDQELKREINQLSLSGNLVHPLIYAADKGGGIKSLRRRFYILANKLNHYRKFKRYYPKRSADGL